jgi:hypothetical protein
VGNYKNGEDDERAGDDETGDDEAGDDERMVVGDDEGRLGSRNLSGLGICVDARVTWYSPPSLFISALLDDQGASQNHEVNTRTAHFDAKKTAE